MQKTRAAYAAVSMRIIELERELAVNLFDRSQRTARITIVGRELLKYVEILLSTYSEMRACISMGDNMPGTLRIGVAEVISITWLPIFISEVHAIYPKLRIELEEALTRNLVHDLETGKLDLVLAPGHVAGYELSEVALGEVNFEWMCSPSIDVPIEPVSPIILQELPLIALGRGSFHYLSIENWFKVGNARCRHIDTCKSMGVAASLAMSGLGVTLLPRTCFDDSLQSGKLRCLDAEPAFPPIPFTATFTTGMYNAVTQKIAKIAQNASTFDNIPTDLPSG